MFQRDVVVISCDLVMDISLHHIADIYRTYDATVTMLLYATPDPSTDVPVPGPKSKKRSGMFLLLTSVVSAY